MGLQACLHSPAMQPFRVPQSFLSAVTGWLHRLEFWHLQLGVSLLSDRAFSPVVCLPQQQQGGDLLEGGWAMVRGNSLSGCYRRSGLQEPKVGTKAFCG
mmetsp:Transcript_4652/g.8402  ORF Transcript_4652/g.8402 Transcript_4652/m.8402 type:complete len:99 (-) Transcript_4652:1007-1303(-)